MGTMKDALQETNHSTVSKDDDKKKKESKPMASVSETMSFVFDCGCRVKLLFATGTVGGVLNGLVYPILAYLFSSSFSDISAASNNGLSQIRKLAYTFMIVGAYALVAATVQSWAFEMVAYHGSQSFRLQWFKALLRQDPSFFDVYDVGGVAAQVGPNSNKYRRGIGRKFGEGVQFMTTGIFGLAYAFWASWRVAFVVLAVIPFVTIAALATMRINQTKGSRAAQTYKKAGGIAYSSVSAIKTVLSLNAVTEMVRQYYDATQLAFEESVSVLVKQGLAFGGMMGSFLALYAVLTLFGAFLLYRDVEDTGCDPSDGVEGNTTCDNAGPDVFGAMLGVAFAAQGVSQVGNFFESFTTARVAAHEALLAINRKPGAESVTIYKEEGDDDIGTTTHSRKSKPERDIENGEKDRIVKAILPAYEIDSSSDTGLKPEDISGNISIKDVHFSYPTRPGDPILNGLNLEIAAGQTVALVGPSGGGKSTVVAMLERFYDPHLGSIEVDGVNIKDLNVKHLRSMIGYVGQEPTLFATTIRGNIQYGNPSATQEQIEAAARMANAHDFISSFSDGYDTQVGDKGSQLSGGQKQRIAIARVLVGNPKILLLDEATSALDAESELVVQDALDNILEQKKITTIIIAHRLSTIRNADQINVIVTGEVIESGNHDELMAKQSYYRKLVEKQEGGGDDDENSTPGSSRRNSENDLTKLADNINKAMHADHSTIHIEFKDVDFAYPTRPKKKIFDGFNLVVHQGETVALCGPSGGGKSTVVGLVERFYDPSGGAIEYKGHDIRTLNVGWYRDQIGYVGQEPTLFNDTIARNIAYGALGATQAEIEEAAKQANAHDFIMQFPEGYDTPVAGSGGSQLSGGQKQRIAIARALVKKPQILILDEATSALDNESESIVQEAINKLMESRDHTVIVIAHRLSTIRNADHIALIAEGKVIEYGSHDELLEKPHGRYRRLFESSKRRSTVDSVGLRHSMIKKVEEDEDQEEEEIDWEAEIEAKEEEAFNAARARQLARPDASYMLAGSIGAVMAGAVYPMWGILFAETIDLLFRRVKYCEEGNIPEEGFESCPEYWKSIADSMQDKSFRLAVYWAIVVFGCLAGFALLYWGFGMASERLNKRVRDSSFSSLLRQEIAYFDKRSVGSITSQLQDDAARIHAFSGEPVRSFIVALSSIVTGLVLSFVFMWPFALLAIGCIPLMGFATSIEMKKFLGEDQGDDNAADGLNTPGGIIVETLLNIRTVSALTLEQQRYEDYEKALVHSEPSYKLEAFMSGLTSGMSMFIQQWINALQLWFGGWLLFTFPDDYEFKDFLIANFAVLFSLFGLGAAFQDISDRKQVEKSAGRIFYLLDRESAIDPLSDVGKKPDERAPVNPAEV